MVRDNEMFQEVVAILDSFASEDREAGRPDPVGYVERQLAAGFLYRDRKRG